MLKRHKVRRRENLDENGLNLQFRFWGTVRALS